jgi:guanylate kinase
MKGNLVIITSPSGGGKGTLIREVLLTVPNIGYSISYTTRPARVSEENGREYFFVSPDEFENLRAGGLLLESAEVHGNLYGTSLHTVQEIIDSGRDIILEIDVQGAKIILEKMPEAVSIFIMPPSFEVLKARLTARATENYSDLNLRLLNSFTEVREYEHFQYVVINQELFKAAADLKTIILGERLRRDRQSGPIYDILNNFDVSKLSKLENKG